MGALQKDKPFVGCIRSARRATSLRDFSFGFRRLSLDGLAPACWIGGLPRLCDSGPLLNGTLANLGVSFLKRISLSG